MMRLYVYFIIFFLFYSRIPMKFYCVFFFKYILDVEKIFV